MTRVIHPFEPVFDSDSEILILGSFPSVKSRENGFYYGHPRNRFWKVLSAIFHTDEPLTNSAKKQLLLSHHIALWDMLASCTIIGSSDTSIRDAVSNDLTFLLAQTKITRILINGSKATALFRKHVRLPLDIEVITVPSTSAANAGCDLDTLIQAYKQALSL